MITVPIKKTWNGFASIRSQDLQRCLDTKQDLRIEFNGETMTIPFAKLLHPLQIMERPIKSKFAGVYTLYDFRWEPDNKNVENLLIKPNATKQTVETKGLF